jgi:hypothetical protein
LKTGGAIKSFKSRKMKWRRVDSVRGRHKEMNKYHYLEQILKKDSGDP